MTTQQNAKNDQYPYQHIFERDNFTCRYCGWDGRESFEKFFIANFSIDHIKPIVLGGNVDDSNLALSCHSCNLYKGQQDCQNFEEARKFVLKKRKEAEAWYNRFVQPFPKP